MARVTSKVRLQHGSLTGDDRPNRRRLRFESLEDRRLLATFTVTSLDDAPVAMVGEAPGTLRQAIFDANNLPGFDIVNFDPALTAGGPVTIALNEGELIVNDLLQISGPGAHLLTIDAQYASRIINFVSSSGVLGLINITLTGGRTTGDNDIPSEALFSGGAIRSMSVDEILLLNVVITGNGTTGIRARGGAIFSRGDVTVNRSTISGNTTSGSQADAGAILAYDHVYITASTISNNSTLGGDSDGGGVQAAHITTLNSTISGNHSVGRGGGLTAFGVLTLMHSTVANNSAENYAGVEGRYSLHVSHSIIAGNTSQFGARDVAGGQSGSFSVDHSIFGSTSGLDAAQIGAVLSGSGNLVNVDPLLEPLADNGGPTNTHALNVFSPAIHAGDPAYDPYVEPADQRGEVRIFGVRIDIGAFEWQGFGGPHLFVVDSLTDIFDGNIGPGQMSLREAIYLANLTADADTIHFSPTLFSAGPAIINLSNLGDLAISSSLSINGPGANRLTLNAYDPTPTLNNRDGSRIFNVNNDNNNTFIDVEFHGLTLTGADPGGSGGAIVSAENLTIADSIITGNYSMGHGGAIYHLFGALNIDRCALSNNSVAYLNYSRQGGAIFASEADVTITDSTISGNSASGQGGGIFLHGGNITVSGSTLNNNLARLDGGAARLDMGTGYAALISNSTISGNRANTTAGGINFQMYGGATARIEHSTITLNIADNDNNGTGNTGGVRMDGPDAVVLDHTIIANNDDRTNVQEDLSGDFTARYSLIGSNVGSNLASTPTGIADANGNLIGPLLTTALTVFVEIAAMGDFEAGINGDNYLFEYSINGGTFVPLFTSSVNEAIDQNYTPDGFGGTVMLSLNDPLLMNGTLLNDDFRTFTATIPAGGQAIHTLDIRFTALTDGTDEAFAWRNLTVRKQSDSGVFGRVASTADIYAAFFGDPDSTASNSMFGIRSRPNPGFEGIPAAMLDDSQQPTLTDFQGIIGRTDNNPFFGVVDTLSGKFGGTKTATWTFVNPGIPFDPRLGSLLPHGGPTATHAPLAGSPVLEAGDASEIAGENGISDFDQRGGPSTRIFGAAIDIGAYETQIYSPVTLIVDTLADEDNSDYSAGDLSLREAIRLTNDRFGSADTIEFASSLTAGGPATILLRHGELQVIDALTINGPGIDLLTIDASGNDRTPDQNNGDGSRVFNIDDGDFGRTVDVSISGLAITGGEVKAGAGGGIMCSEDLAISDSRVSDNWAEYGGGGIYISTNGNVAISNCTISDNATSNVGGGIHISPIGNVTISISNCWIHDNAAAYAGGGVLIYAFYPGIRITVANCTIESNTVAGGSGGGICLSENTYYDADAVATLIHGSIIRNNSASEGGGIYHYGYYGTLTVIDSSITQNNAGYGGGIYSLGKLIVDHAMIDGNGAADDGGGIYSLNTVTVSNATISENTTSGDGGGIYCEGVFSLINTTIINNSADGSGGGVYSFYASVHGSTISNNSANGYGGGVFASSYLVMTHSTVVYNIANSDGSGNVGRGGGIATYGDDNDLFLLDHVIVAANRRGVSTPDDIDGTVSATWSLIETAGGATIAGSNILLGFDPLLGALADNGGPTMTHALLAGSPAIDAGDPTIAFDASGYDQRGAAYLRVFDGDGAGGVRIDIGAVEFQPPPQPLPGDYNRDNKVNSADYVLWRKTNGAMGMPAYSGADGSGDTKVDGSDYAVWTTHYGETVTQGPGGGQDFASSFALPGRSGYDSDLEPYSAAFQISSDVGGLQNVINSALNDMPENSYAATATPMSHIKLRRGAIVSRTALMRSSAYIRSAMLNDVGLMAWLDAHRAPLLGVDRLSGFRDFGEQGDDDTVKTFDAALAWANITKDNAGTAII